MNNEDSSWHLNNPLQSGLKKAVSYKVFVEIVNNIDSLEMLVNERLILTGLNAVWRKFEDKKIKRKEMLISDLHSEVFQLFCEREVEGYSLNVDFGEKITEANAIRRKKLINWHGHSVAQALSAPFFHGFDFYIEHYTEYGFQEGEIEKLQALFTQFEKEDPQKDWERFKQAVTDCVFFWVVIYLKQRLKHNEQKIDLFLAEYRSRLLAMGKVYFDVQN